MGWTCPSIINTGSELHEERIQIKKLYEITWIILIFSGNFGETERTEARVETRDPRSEGRTRGLQEGTQVKQADNR